MKYYWFTFIDGYSVCVRGFSKQELRVEENKHGKLLRNKGWKIMTNYNCIGKTLSEIAKETPISFSGGYSVFLLQDETDTTGKKIDISYSVMAILEKHPEIANYKVKFENDFYGMTVLRVIKEF